jgi:hypothetical protein
LTKASCPSGPVEFCNSPTEQFPEAKKTLARDIRYSTILV